MKPLFEKVLLSKSPFVTKVESFDRFDIQWHLHPEVELVFIFKCDGVINVGDHVSNITDHELLLLGPNLPHSWHGIISSKPAQRPKQIVIQFAYDFLGKDFFENQAMARIRELLDRAHRGVRFHDKEITRIAGRIRKMPEMPDFEQTIELLEILNLLAQSRHYSLLSSIGYSSHLNENESVRLNSIYKYILSNFRNNVNLKSVSEFAHLTPQAFSKYFKERSRKNFITFLNELKIGYACRLINERKMNFSQVCYECGYTSLSNFNRQFRRIMRKTPSEYANQLTESRLSQVPAKSEF